MEGSRASKSSQKAGTSGSSSSQTANKNKRSRQSSPPVPSRNSSASGTGASSRNADLSSSNKRSPAPAPGRSASSSKSGASGSSLKRKEPELSDLDDDSSLSASHAPPPPATAAGSREREGKDGDSLLHDSDSHPGHSKLPGGKGAREKEGHAQQQPPQTDFQPIKGALFKDMDADEEREKEQRHRTQEVSPQSYNIIIPSYSAWFSYDSINAIEKRSLPEYFNSQNASKSPEAYMTVRNFMIDSYRLNPTEYLTSTSARRNLTGDVCGIVRIHAFLEQWGLINFQVDSDNRPMGFGPSNTAHYNILLDTPVGIQPLQPVKHQGLPSANADYICKLSDVTKEQQEADAAAAGAPAPGGCGENAGPSYGLRADSYIKRSAARGKVGREWTEQETLLLLEALEMYKDDWNKVAEHVGSRTQDECVLHFLKLPIEDPYLEDCKDIGPLAHYPIPFSKAGNPVMTTVAFLASTVDPRIASAAAQAALEKYCKLKEEVPPWLVETHQKAVGEAFDAAKRGEGALPDDRFGLAAMNIAGLADGENSGEKAPAAPDAAAGVAEESVTAAAVPEPTASTSTDATMENGKNGTPPTAGEVAGAAPTAELASDWERLKKVTDREITRKDLQMAASVALSSAAVKAKHLATVEERKIKSMVALLVETQMKKLETKLKHFEELENIIEAEREKLELLRQQLIQERQQFHSEQVKAMEVKARLAAQQQMQQQHGPLPVLGVAAPTPSISLPGGAFPSTSGGMGPTPPQGLQTPLHMDVAMTGHPSALSPQPMMHPTAGTPDLQRPLSANTPQQQQPPPPFQPQFAAVPQREMGGAAPPGYPGAMQLRPPGQIAVRAPMGGQPPAGYPAQFAGAAPTGPHPGMGMAQAGGQPGQMFQPHPGYPQQQAAVQQQQQYAMQPQQMQAQGYPGMQQGYPGMQQQQQAPPQQQQYPQLSQASLYAVQQSQPQQRMAQMQPGGNPYGQQMAPGQQQQGPAGGGAMRQMGMMPPQAQQQPPPGQGQQSGQPPQQYVMGHYPGGGGAQMGQYHAHQMPMGPPGSQYGNMGAQGQGQMQQAPAQGMGMNMPMAAGETLHRSGSESRHSGSDE
ncbi:SWI/SNF complex subunit SMARCC2-like [Paramacrobiotus metropolitanus]|uniref:SWI/SNF complex subunit SMARCC2-like n=1 Tax=Paramacrobiotus metropolitanus TaxID=2943436 RepID=UPI002445E737|nr:SWI/SNF complex subunit SMARCC2-like [Paramacrobiotus metropolitanus]